MQAASNVPPCTAPGGPLMKPEVPAFCELIPPSQEFSVSQADIELLANGVGSLSLPGSSRPPPSEVSDESFIYREQIDKLRQLISELQKKLQDEQARNRGLEILSACGHEQQLENKRLKAQVNYFKTQVSALEKRLGSVDQEELSSYHQSVKDHSVLPTVSVESFDNLVRENARLKQTMQAMETEQMAAMSSKDEEMQQLRLRMQEQASVTAPIETETLRSLKQQLDQMSKGFNSLIHQRLSPEPAKSESKLSLMQEVSLDSKCEKEALKNQISRLDEQLQEVIQMNARWQSYNTEREKYVQALQLKLSEMEEKLIAASRVQISQEQQERIDRLIQEHKKKITMIEDGKIKVEDENRLLRQEIEGYRQQTSHQQQQLSSMQARIQDLLRSGRQQQSSDEDLETIDLQRAQIKLLTEDFESERRDRQMEHQRLSTLEREHAFLKERLNQYQGHQQDDLMESRRRALDQYQQEHNQRGTTAPPSQGGLVARGLYYADGEASVEQTTDEDGGFDEIDYAYPLPQMELAASKGTSSDSAPAPDKALECPCCHRKFNAEQYLSLLEHIDVCGNP